MNLSTLIKLVFFIILVLGVYLIFTNQVEGRTKMILIVFIIVIGIYLFMKLPLFRSYNSLQQSPASAKDHYTIESSTLKPTTGHYTLSTWFYVDDWNYRYGSDKVIIENEYTESVTDDSGTTTTTVIQNPKIAFDAYKNDIKIDVNILDPETDATITKEVVINNVNLQKWVSLIMTINDRTMDVYLNGKLVKTTAMENIIDASTFNEGTINITPNGGFGGFISEFRYYNKFITPQQAWNIYKQGYGDSFSNFLDRYNLKLSFYEDNVMTKEYNVF